MAQVLWRTKSQRQEPLLEFGADSLIPALGAIFRVSGSIPNGHQFIAHDNDLSSDGGQSRVPRTIFETHYLGQALVFASISS